MAMASIASRPSNATSVGKPAVQPSTDRPTIWLAAGSTPAMSSRTSSRTPCQRAVPIRSPPTSLDTHAIVTSASIRAISSRSS